jgi:hypothetical protein
MSSDSRATRSSECPTSALRMLSIRYGVQAAVADRAAGELLITDVIEGMVRGTRRPRTTKSSPRRAMPKRLSPGS